MDEAELSAELERELQSLDHLREALRSEAPSILRQELSSALASLEQSSPQAERVGSFADWYFSYSTSYKLLQLASHAAASSALSSVLRGDEQPCRAAATAAVTQAINQKYEALCLKPSLLEPALKRAFGGAARRVHADFLRGMEGVREGGLALLEERTSHATPIERAGEGGVVLQVDWEQVRGRAGNAASAPEGGGGRWEEEGWVTQPSAAKVWGGRWEVEEGGVGERAICGVEGRRWERRGG